MSACSSSDDTSAAGGTSGSAGSAGSAGRGGAAGSAGSTNVAGSGGSAGTAGSGVIIGVGGEGGAIGVAGAGGAAGEGGAGSATIEQNVAMALLTSDQAGAVDTDANLINAWGLAINPVAEGGPLFWVSAADKGVSAVIDAAGHPQSLVVTIPSANGTDPGSPTGQVYNGTPAFKGDVFIFATEDGLITGWQTGTAAVTRVNHATTASYKGLAIVTNGTTPSLAAANFKAGTVDVFDTAYAAAVDTTLFTDPTMPAGFAPFNVAELGGKVYVTYAKQDAAKADDVPAVGNGYVDMFGVDGTFTKRLISQGVLNSPWGLALSPDDWGSLPNALLVGNFGDGLIHAYDPTTGEMLGELSTSGKALAIDGLWALSFGPNSASANLSSQLFFTAGPVMETHGQFGKLTLNP
ncbi:MAG TPA: TIGR03118 family protein [Polyangiaceae bacterium]|nr:TIGR03118 family protein [Polyangiaceae bacterium]